jgi:hypothetical protein
MILRPATPYEVDFVRKIATLTGAEIKEEAIKVGDMTMRFIFVGEKKK